MATVKINVVVQSEGTVAYPTYNSTPKEITQTAEGMGGPGVISVTTSEVTESLVAGTVVLQNLDPTNFVTIGFGIGDRPMKLTAANEPTVLQLAANDTMYLAADTATCKVLIYNWNA